MVGVLELSKPQLVSLVRGGKEAQNQLLGTRLYAGNGIYAGIVANGVSQNNHILCCLCKSVLQTGSSNKSNLSRHRTKHLRKGDTTNPEIIKAIINDFLQKPLKILISRRCRFMNRRYIINRQLLVCKLFFSSFYEIFASKDRKWKVPRKEFQKLRK